jgi:hypothetical protein
MKLTHILGATLAVGIVGAVPVCATPQLSLAVPPFAFLRYHVDSPQQLAREVSFDATVQARFSRHFNMSGLALTNFIEKDLVLKPLTAAHEFHIYCVTNKGHEYSFVANLPAGTPVFVRKQDGLPVLNQADGNPLIDNLPPVLSHNSNMTTDLAQFSTPSIDLSKMKTVDNPIAPDSTPDIDWFDYNGQTVGAKKTDNGIIFVDQNDNPIYTPFTPGPLYGEIFAYAAGAGIIAALGNGTGGGGKPAGNPVPEPAPLAVLAVGAIGVGMLAARKKSLAR